MDALLTPNMLFREAQFIAKIYHTKIDNLCLHDNGKLSIIRNGKEKFCNTNYEDLQLSLDDFAERYIKPVIWELLDWDRAFKLETWK